MSFTKDGIRDCNGLRHLQTGLLDVLRRDWGSGFVFSSLRSCTGKGFPCDLYTSQSFARQQAPTIAGSWWGIWASMPFQKVRGSDMLDVETRPCAQRAAFGVQHLNDRVLFINNCTHESLIIDNHWSLIVIDNHWQSLITNHWYSQTIMTYPRLEFDAGREWACTSKQRGLRRSQLPGISQTWEYSKVVWFFWKGSVYLISFICYVSYICYFGDVIFGTRFSLWLRCWLWCFSWPTSRTGNESASFHQCVASSGSRFNALLPPKYLREMPRKSSLRPGWGQISRPWSWIQT